MSYEELVEDAEVRLEAVVEHHGRHHDGCRPRDDHGHAHDLSAGERLVQDLRESERDHDRERTTDDDPDDRCGRRSARTPANANTVSEVVEADRALVEAREGDVARGVVEHHSGGEQHDAEDEQERRRDPRQRLQEIFGHPVPLPPRGPPAGVRGRPEAAPAQVRGLCRLAHACIPNLPRCRAGRQPASTCCLDLGPARQPAGLRLELTEQRLERTVGGRPLGVRRRVELRIGQHVEERLERLIAGQRSAPGLGRPGGSPRPAPTARRRRPSSSSRRTW